MSIQTQAMRALELREEGFVGGVICTVMLYNNLNEDLLNKSDLTEEDLLNLKLVKDEVEIILNKLKMNNIDVEFWFNELWGEKLLKKIKLTEIINSLTQE